MNTSPTTPTALVTDPGAVMGHVIGHWQARVLLTAVETDLFTLLADGPMTPDELSSAAGFAVHPEAEHLYTVLVGMGMLERDGDRLRNAPVTGEWLVRGRPGFLGGYLRFVDTELNPAWAGLTEALRTGRPQNPAATEGNPYDTLYRNPSATEDFVESMDVLSTPTAEAIAALDWSGYRSVIDVGGARGSTAQRIAARHPHLDAGVFDLPPLEAAFGRHMAALGDEHGVTFHGGDFFIDPLPAADVHVLGHVLHNWGDADRLRILLAVHTALPAGGAVFVYDPMLTGEAAPLPAALAGLSMLVWSSGGGEYAVEECHGWLREAGFRPETVDLPAGLEDVLVIGHKEA